jgi:hypothetical protein
MLCWLKAPLPPAGCRTGDGDGDEELWDGGDDDFDDQPNQQQQKATPQTQPAQGAAATSKQQGPAGAPTQAAGQAAAQPQRQGVLQAGRRDATAGVDGLYEDDDDGYGEDPYDAVYLGYGDDYGQYG